jgi:phospholipid/cholesterol/gamma-HCH transport system substrate-binding protein
MRVRQGQPMPNWVLGLIAIVLVTIATVIAFSGLLGVKLPWQGGYEVNAVFSSAQNLRRDAPVRIAGVNVGQVSKVQALGSAETEEVLAQAGDDAPELDSTNAQQAAIVTMELKDDALPLKTDATFKVRPRLFLEGNNFVDLEPGSPNADEIEEGHTFPVNQTSYSVQLDQVLTTLQSDVRQNLKTFLDQFGNALVKDGGAEGFRELYRTSAPAGKYTSQVNEALLGTEDGDLSGVIHGLDRVVNGLGRNELTLQNLVTDFATVSGSFAAEDVALGQAIERLPGVLEAADPAFANLNAAFPPLRAFAREALPGVESTAPALRDATPFISQLRRLVSEEELRGLVADLRPTIPELANLTQETIPFTDETRALSSCFNEVIIPWSNDTVEAVNDPTNLYPLDDDAGRVFEETGYVLTGLTGIGRNGDANGQWARVLGQSGTNLIDTGNQFALTPFPILGAMPAHESSAKTQLTDDHPCERQEPPDLGSQMGNAPTGQSLLRQADLTALDDEGKAALQRLADRITALGQVDELRADGDKAGANKLIEQAQRMLARIGINPEEAAQWGGGG